MRRTLGNLLIGLGASIDDAVDRVHGLADRLDSVSEFITGVGYRAKFKGDDHPAYEATAAPNHFGNGSGHVFEGTRVVDS